MSDPPPGFSRSEADGAVLVLRDDVAQALRVAGCADPGVLRERAERSYRGRTDAYGVDVDGVGPVFVRPYQHGGLLGRITGDRYSGDGRFLAEVAHLAGAAAAGVPVPEVLGYVSRPAGPLLRRGWLVTREVPGAVDLLAFLESGPPATDRRVALRTAGRAMRALHDAGFSHPDLHLLH